MSDLKSNRGYQSKADFLNIERKLGDPIFPAPFSQLLPAIEMSTQDRAEEAEIFQEDQEERLRDVEFPEPPLTRPSMYMNDGG